MRYCNLFSKIQLPGQKITKWSNRFLIESRAVTPMDIFEMLFKYNSEV